MAVDVLAVDEWQTQQMDALGLDPADIITLVGEGYDWHAVADLIDKGCPTRLVSKILV